MGSPREGGDGNPAKAPDVSSPLGLDLRSLGLWRVSLGLVLVLDWLVRSFQLREHYTSEGVLPLRTLLNQPTLGSRLWSVFYLSDSVGYVALLFLLGFFSALALMVGYRPRVSGWIAWVLLISVQHRNPLVLTKGDSYLLLLLFWGNFLPWGEVFSVAEKSGEELKRVEVPPLAATAYLGQICLLYWFSALPRTHPSWVVDGSALYRAFHLEPLVKPLGRTLLGLGPDWLAFFTFLALAMEAFGPFLLLVPLAAVRVLAVAAIVIFHLGIYLTLDINNFAWICMMAPLGLLPSLFWRLPPSRWLERVLRAGFGALARRIRVPGEAETSTSSPILAKLAIRILPGLALLVACLCLWFEWKGEYTKSWEMRWARSLGLWQSWGMFSPGPPNIHGWQSAEAHLTSGAVVDLISGRPYPTDGWYQGLRGWFDQRARVYRNILLTNRFGAHGQAYLEYLVRRWDRGHPGDPVRWAEYLWHSSTIEPAELLPEQTREVIARYQS